MNEWTSRNLAAVFGATCYWCSRRETPETVASRLLRTLEELQKIGPDFANWYVVEDLAPKAIAPMSYVELVEFVAEHVRRSEDGTPQPQCGYRVQAFSGPEKTPRWLEIMAEAGQRFDMNYLSNTVHLTTEPLCPENEDLISLRVLRPALLALVSGWEPTWCGVGPGALNKFIPKLKPHRPWFGLKWVTYLSSQLAPLVTPPSTAICERTLEGGLLMIATEERFDVNNPMHMAVARDIEAALAPVNALPWPPEKALR